MQLLDRSKKNIEKKFKPIPQKTLNAARSIIRFEVQYKYHKVYMISKEAERAGNHHCNKYKNLLTDEYCLDVISSYFNKIIGRGDWYTLQKVISMVNSQSFNEQKKKRLINALHLVNQCRSIARAKDTLEGHDLKAFKKTLKELSSLRINPVTIPKEWGIKHILNLLYAYYDKVQEEKDRKEMEKFQWECFNKYFHSH